MSDEDMSGDIKKAREAGKSDEDILAGIKSYKPEYADDIDAAIKAGKSPKDVISAVSSYKPPAAPTSAITQGAGMAMRAAHDAAGLAKTVDMVAGTHLAPAADAATQDPAGYQPANIHAGQILDGVHNDWQSMPRLGANLLNYAKNVGQATVENSPTLAASLGGGAAGAALGSPLGPLGATIGGGIGATLGYFGLHGGRDAQRSANNRAPSADGVDAPISGQDIAAATADAAINGNLSRMGVKVPFSTPLTAGAGAAGLLARAGEAGLKDAAIGGAGAAADQALIDRKVDPSAIADAALMAGTAGATTRTTLGAVKDANAYRIAQKAGLEDHPETKAAVNDVANQIQQSGADTPAKRAAALEQIKLRSGLETEVAADRVKEGLKPTTNADGSTTEINPEVGLALKMVTKSVQKGLEPTQADMDTLRSSAVPGVTDLLKSVRQQDAVNRLSNLQGGLADSDAAKQFLSPLHGVGKLAIVLNALHDPAKALEIAGGEMAGRLALKAVDHLTGSADPLKLITDRYAGTPDPVQTAGLIRRMPQLVEPTQEPQQPGSPQQPAPPPQGPPMAPARPVVPPDASPATPVAPPQLPPGVGPKARPPGIELDYEGRQRFQPLADIFNSETGYRGGYAERSASRAQSYDDLQNNPNISSKAKDYLASKREAVLDDAHANNGQEAGMKATEAHLEGLKKIPKTGARDHAAAVKHLKEHRGQGRKHSFRTSWRHK